MLTLEERERIAYIQNSPDHPLLCEALDGDEEMAEEIVDLKAENDRLDKLLSTANDDLEKSEDKLEEIEAERDDLQQQIEAAGIDLA